MLLKMATKAEIENNVIEKPSENQDLITVCNNIPFSSDKMKQQPTRKRCVSSSILISSSPKKKKKEGQNIIPPKKFLLGGSIFDPLNLNSLQNEEINKAMNKTPKSSPLRSNTVNIKNDHVNVKIPRNLSDPLELCMCGSKVKGTCSNLDSFKQNTQQKCKSTKLMLKSLSDSGLLIENTPEKIISSFIDDITEEIEGGNNSSIPPYEKSKVGSLECGMCKLESNNIPRAIIEVIEEIKEVIENGLHSIDAFNTSIPSSHVVDTKIVEPSKQPLSPIPDKNINSQDTQKQQGKCVKNLDVQTSLSQKPCSSPQIMTTVSVKPKQNVNKNEPKFKEKNELFKYGNYNRYYGYRNPDDEDNRLKVLAEHMDLFYGKDVLDIGCNIGHVTLSVARDFCAKSIVGMDIDRKLINIARKNIQYYINDTARSSSHLSSNYKRDYALNSRNDPYFDITASFPTALPMLYGPINLPGMEITGRFPYNVSFVQGNYVLESDVMLSIETCKFDVILCLSITKWLHLNWGDDGLKRAFKRMYAQLRPGGILVVEPQPWKSYSRRKSLTETIWRNYKTIQLKPAMFTEYLLNEVGFVNCETLAMPHNPSKGFQRPLKLYRKPNILITKNEPNCTIVRPN